MESDRYPHSFHKGEHRGEYGYEYENPRPRMRDPNFWIQVGLAVVALLFIAAFAVFLVLWIHERNECAPPSPSSPPLDNRAEEKEAGGSALASYAQADCTEREAGVLKTLQEVEALTDGPVELGELDSDAKKGGGENVYLQLVATTSAYTLLKQQCAAQVDSGSVFCDSMEATVSAYVGATKESLSAQIEMQKNLKTAVASAYEKCIAGWTTSLTSVVEVIEEETGSSNPDLLRLTDLITTTCTGETFDATNLLTDLTAVHQTELAKLQTACSAPEAPAVEPETAPSADDAATDNQAAHVPSEGSDTLTSPCTQVPGGFIDPNTHMCCAGMSYLIAEANLCCAPNLDDAHALVPSNVVSGLVQKYTFDGELVLVSTGQTVDTTCPVAPAEGIGHSTWRMERLKIAKDTSSQSCQTAQYRRCYQNHRSEKRVTPSNWVSTYGIQACGWTATMSTPYFYTSKTTQTGSVSYTDVALVCSMCTKSSTDPSCKVQQSSFSPNPPDAAYPKYFLFDSAYNEEGKNQRICASCDDDSSGTCAQAGSFCDCSYITASSNVFQSTWGAAIFAKSYEDVCLY